MEIVRTTLPKPGAFVVIQYEGSSFLGQVLDYEKRSLKLSFSPTWDDIVLVLITFGNTQEWIPIAIARDKKLKHTASIVVLYEP
uniref:Uncharacterized protein n=1 Tax=viral metagenome TaxID=1070528 RepID=A0A6M3IT24_9ZZZZ